MVVRYGYCKNVVLVCGRCRTVRVQVQVSKVGCERAWSTDEKGVGEVLS